MVSSFRFINIRQVALAMRWPN